MVVRWWFGCSGGSDGGFSDTADNHNWNQPNFIFIFKNDSRSFGQKTQNNILKDEAVIEQYYYLHRFVVL